MAKIFLLTSNDNNLTVTEFNKGVTALIITTIQSLKKFIPHAEFVTKGQFSKKFSLQHELKVIKGKLFAYKILSFSETFKSLLLLFRCLIWAGLNKYLGICANVLVNHRQLKEMRHADIILVFIQDTFSDNHKILLVIDHTIEILTACLLNKRVMVWNSSIGPLKHWLTSRLGRLIFNKINLIILREAISLTHLQEARINKPRMYAIPDMVFLLKPASKHRTNKILLEQGIDTSDRPLIGICVNEEIPLKQRPEQGRYRKIGRNIYSFLSYFLPDGLLPKIINLARRLRLYPTEVEEKKFIQRKSIAQVIDYLTEKFDATVILVPHVISSKVGKYKNTSDDISEAQAVFEMVKSKNKVKVITGEYTAPEIKGVIGQCDLFIGMRMHACVDSLSQSVPTLGIAYNYKFLGIMGLVGQEKWICDIISTKELISKIEEIWKQKQKIREELNMKLPIIKKQALRHAQLASELLFSKKKNYD